MPRRRFRTVSLAGPHPTHRLMNTMLVYNGQRAMGNRTSEWDFEMSGDGFGRMLGGERRGRGRGRRGLSAVTVCMVVRRRRYRVPIATRTRLAGGGRTTIASDAALRLQRGRYRFSGFLFPVSGSRRPVPGYGRHHHTTTPPHEHTNTQTHDPSLGSPATQDLPVDSYTHTRNSRVFYESNRRFVLNHPYISRV